MKVYPPGARIAGRYEVAGRPLLGGMGIVYLCDDLREDRPVALKTFKPEYLPDRVARDRFLREGFACGHLRNYPYIVRHNGVERRGGGRGQCLVLQLVAQQESHADPSLLLSLRLGICLKVGPALCITDRARTGSCSGHHPQLPTQWREAGECVSE